MKLNTLKNCIAQLKVLRNEQYDRQNTREVEKLDKLISELETILNDQSGIHTWKVLFVIGKIFVPMLIRQFYFGDE